MGLYLLIRLFIIGYEEKGIRQYQTVTKKKKAKEIAELRKSQTGISNVYTSYTDVYSLRELDMMIEFYKDLNKMLKQRSGLVESEVKGFEKLETET